MQAANADTAQTWEKEEAIVLLLKNNSEQGFKQLVEAFQSWVYNVCLGFLKHEEDAEDVAQEVFIEVYRSINTFKGKSSLRTWVYRIAVNKSLEVIRRNKRAKRFQWFYSLTGNEDWIEKNTTDFVHPGVALENKERARILFNHIDLLPNNQRIAFTLHKVEGLSYQEIGEIMKITIPAVESLMMRAKKKLQQCLRTYYEQQS